LDKYGLKDKRIWINETNAGPTDDPLWPVVRPQYQINLNQQAAFIVQAAALGLAGGAERIAVYKSYDWNLSPGAESFGLIRADGSRRPAFDAWKMVIQQFEGIKQATVAQTANTEAVRLMLPDESFLYVLWARTAADVNLTAAVLNKQIALMDQYGHNLPSTLDSAGQLLFTLKGARCDKKDGCAVGGDVQIIHAAQASLQEKTSSGMVDIKFE
jgi:hypothetical protein